MPTDALDPVTQHHVMRAVDAPVEEFGDTQSRETIERVMEDSVAQLAGSAEVDDFIATLAHRFTRERLKAMGRAHGPAQALPDVLFVGLGDSGRGQIAAALVTLRSEGRVVAHSAGRSAAVQVDPAVVAVMQELDVDLTDAYAKPLSTEVLEAADVVVTMGRSVGSVEIPETTRHLDWRVGDPTGTSIQEARRVREDIDRRVHELLSELDPGVGERGLSSELSEASTTSSLEPCMTCIRKANGRMLVRSWPRTSSSSALTTARASSGRSAIASMPRRCEAA